MKQQSVMVDEEDKPLPCPASRSGDRGMQKKKKRRGWGPGHVQEARLT